jgi:hypothetical protein
VVGDRSGVDEGADPVADEVLATAGRHLRDWPGIPVAVVCPDPIVCEAFRAHPLGGHLIVTTSLFSAMSEVPATPALAVEWLHLSPHPTAPRASRDFVTRALLDWRLSRVIPFASLVISELVASSTVSAGTDIDLSVAWNVEALRLTVQDHGHVLPHQGHTVHDLHGRGLTVVSGLSCTFGVLPTGGGGKVVWAVLEARRPRLWDRRIQSARVKESQQSPVLPQAAPWQSCYWAPALARAQKGNPSHHYPVETMRSPEQDLACSHDVTHLSTHAVPFTRRPGTGLGQHLMRASHFADQAVQRSQVQGAASSRGPGHDRTPQ